MLPHEGAEGLLVTPTKPLEKFRALVCERELHQLPPR